MPERRADVLDALELLAEIVRGAGEAIYSADMDGICTSWNPAAERLYGYSAQEMLGHSLAALYPDGWDAEIDKLKRLGALDKLEPQPLETVRRRKDGELIDVALTFSALRDPDGAVIGGAAIARDISESRRLQAQLEHLANYDALTGLLNRRRFEDELTVTCARAKREERTGAILLLDLDNFKYVNDTFGHHAGDALLSGIAATIAHRLRASDTFARLGGDEFGVIATPASLTQAQRLADDLLTVVREHAMMADGHTIRTTASIGVIEFDGRADPAELLTEVDRAMYESKDAGRDRATAHSTREPERRARTRVSWEQLVREALEQHRFELYCQPILELATRTVSQCELLLRMRGVGGPIYPAAFLGAAERGGLIRTVDRWVIEQAILIAARHRDIRFEINLSGRTTDDPDLARFVSSLIAAAAIDPGNLVFELTETAAIGNIGRARELARSLSELGCRFAIDDFGAGFSTFYYLKHFPADYLKIDGEFVRAPRSRTDELVIESIVRIARDLGKQTIAEFVTDAATLQRMRELGVDFAQGYHVAKPFPVAELERRLKR